MKEEITHSKTIAITDDEGRRADIIFQDGLFKRTFYKVSSSSAYTYEDWMFLKAIAEKIEKKEFKKEE